MNFITPPIQSYLEAQTPKRDVILSDMEAYAALNNFPIIGPLVGRMLFTYARAMKAKRILEMGSGYGYSAVWFARAMGKNGRIFCTEGSPENALRAKRYFIRAGIEKQITFLTGNALTLIDDVQGEFDIIFNDVDKHQYPAVFRKALPRLRTGGLLITDNVLWSGRVLEQNPDADTKGILRYTKLVTSSKQLHTTIIPLRDGVSVSVKL